MKEKTYKNYRFLLYLFIAVFAIMIAGDVVLLVLIVTGNNQLFISYLFFFDNITAAISLALASFYAKKLSDFKIALSSVKEFFKSEHFVYNETVFKRKLTKRLKAKRGLGAVASFGVKGLYSEVLSLYGSDEVKQINEIILSEISSAFNSHPYLYAFNLLDNFLIYSSGDNCAPFYKKIVEVADKISEKIQTSEGLPSLIILIGSYEINRGDQVDDIIRKSNIALKDNASTRLVNDVVVFTPEMSTEGFSRKDLSYELSRGLEEGQLEVYYQPKYDLKLQRFYGAEALIRWNHPVRGLLPPSLFIPFAEQSGLIVQLDRYVFRHVAMDIAKWEKERKRLLKISVNLSRRSVYDSSILNYFVSTMAEFKVNPLLIDIELTESVAAKDTTFVTSIIRKIKGLKMSTSIDDFGVGYSSFVALKKIPFDTMKVDKTFIDDIEIDKKARDMVERVISLGHCLDMKVIAEGVQSAKQVEILKKLDLDAIQGFYYSKPLSCFDYENFLANNRFEGGSKGGKQ